MSGPRVLLLGVGNLLWADEGFGVRCIEAFDAAYELPAEVELMDGGTQGLYLVHHIGAAERVIVFDAVDFGAAPGTLMVVRDDDVPRFIASSKMSLHQAGVSDVLACADLLGRKPAQITVIGAQPVELEDYGGSLTPTIRALLPRALALAVAELRAWGIEVRPRQQPHAGVLPQGLSLHAYEQGRPSAEQAARHGDDRVLARAHWVG
ncbi:MAG: HyaD/HybD family hydrogenase maturation endopeptidase [Lysobacterales bacterium]